MRREVIMNKEIRLSYIILVTAAVFLGIILLIVYVIHREPTITELLTRELHQQFNDSSLPPRINAGTESTHADTLLVRFYRLRDFQPAWINNRGPKKIADSLLRAIRDAEFEGLNPSDYHINFLDSILKKIRLDLKVKLPVDIQQFMSLECLLTDAFFIYSNHLLSGRVNPETTDPEWLTERPEADLIALINRALSGKCIQKTLTDLLPDLPCYAMLRQELIRYKSIAMRGGWPAVPIGPKIKKGDRGFRVAALSARLVASGDLYERSLEAKSVFDDTLEMAIKRFQERNGLEVDGEVGSGTLAALNLPSLYYMHKIAVNMERWRWLPRNLGEKYILVNIASFTLDIVENGHTLLNMPVVVGKHYRKTPVFSGQMEYIVLNPYWYVPSTITFEDILPEVKKDPGYLTQRKIEVVRHWNDLEPVDPFKVAWASFTEENLTYRFRQGPGEQNALGRIKFMFPNKYDVYLHDTPYQSQFKETQRAFSSGCIRLSKPIDLAVYVLKETEHWTKEAIVAALDSVKDFRINLPEPIPVHIFYCTAWTHEDGTIHFRQDIYNRDILVLNALKSVMVLHD